MKYVLFLKVFQIHSMGIQAKKGQMVAWSILEGVWRQGEMGDKASFKSFDNNLTMLT